MAAGDFATRLVRWQTQFGRHDLPWQCSTDPYRVWLSETMLQQTQVATVLKYFDRFVTRFPDVWALAEAPEGDVMALWSGLGYYSRARNLHRCAQVVVRQHGGRFPTTAEELARLPGIGASTAAAIAAFCHGQRVSIFDGNVKRVMARYLGFEQDLASAAASRALKALVDERLPGPAQSHLMPGYTQGLMDLGATVCTPRRPRCGQCPLAANCQAHAQGRAESLPVKSRQRARRTRLWWWLVLWADGGWVWLSRRPARGVWGSLHVFPAYESEAALWDAVPTSLRAQLVEQPMFVHVLTHMDLHIHPRVLRLSVNQQAEADAWLDTTSGAWYHYPSQTAQLGLPTPVSAGLARWVGV